MRYRAPTANSRIVPPVLVTAGPLPQLLEEAPEDLFSNSLFAIPDTLVDTLRYVSVCLVLPYLRPLGRGKEGTPDRTRTCDLQFRKLPLCPPELRGQKAGLLAKSIFVVSACGRRLPVNWQAVPRPQVRRVSVSPGDARSCPPVSRTKTSTRTHDFPLWQHGASGQWAQQIRQRVG